jgi:hypothetical protein
MTRNKLLLNFQIMSDFDIDAFHCSDMSDENMLMFDFVCEACPIKYPGGPHCEATDEEIDRYEAQRDEWFLSKDADSMVRLFERDWMSKYKDDDERKECIRAQGACWIVSQYLLKNQGDKVTAEDLKMAKQMTEWMSRDDVIAAGGWRSPDDRFEGLKMQHDLFSSCLKNGADEGADGMENEEGEGEAIDMLGMDMSFARMNMGTVW